MLQSIHKRFKYIRYYKYYMRNKYYKYYMRNNILVTVTLPRELVDEIDEERGLIPRSAWIRKKLEDCRN